MKAQINISTNQMRGEYLGGAVKELRALRAVCLNDGIITSKNAESYVLKTASAAAHCWAVENKDFVAPLLNRIFAVNNDLDLSCIMPSYDITQDKLWLAYPNMREATAPLKEGEGDFLSLIRQYAMHAMHGAFSSRQDVFHIYQALKCICETDKEERKKPDFVLPVYGGLNIPNEGIGALMKGLSGDGSTVIYAGTGTDVQDGTRARMILRLDWWPEGGDKEVEQLQKVAEAAEQIGYTRLQFWLHSAYPYEALNKKYADYMEVGTAKRNVKGKLQDECLATLKLAGNIFEKVVENPLQAVEFRTASLAEVVESLKNSKNSDAKQGNGVAYAASQNDLGFCTKIMFALESGEAIASGGLFVPAKDKDAHAYVLQAVGDVLPGSAPEAWQGKLQDMSGKLNAAYSYVVLTDSIGHECSLDFAEDQPKWGDSK